ncbi:MAG: type II secretion system protein, partial [Candidatus Omnitrophota bacterium]
RRKDGLTLIEVIVVVAIFSIFSGMLFTVFKSSLDSWRRAENLLDIYQNARLVLEQISGEISSALLDQSSSNTSRWAKFYGIDETGTRIKTNSAKDEIFFVAPVENAGDMDLCEIGYWLDGKGTPVTSDDELKKHFKPFNAPPPAVDFDFDEDITENPPATNNIIAQNITDLQFRYYYRAAAGALPNTITANGSWNSTQNLLANNYDAKGNEGNEKNPDGLPNAVEITLIVRETKPIDPANPKTRTFTTLVAIEGVK